MVTIQLVDADHKQQVKQFVELPFKLYKDCPQWVPPLFTDSYLQLNRKKHPFFEHSDADFFLALQDGKLVGRIAALENKPFNKYHNTEDAEFYFFDSINDQEVAHALFAAVFDWAKQRGLNRVVGPKGMSAFDGYGIQIEGFEHRQMMTMMNYNCDYYRTLVEALGFEKEVDFVSCYLPSAVFKIPERVVRIAQHAVERGHLQIRQFKSKREMVSWADRIGQAYNKAFVSNWEYYPLTANEIKFVVDNIMMVADHRMIKIIMHDEEVVGFLFAFADVSAALQRAQGHLNPLALVDLLLEMRRTKTVAANGMGILPEYQGHGGNAILYDELGKTLLEFHQFAHVEMTQVAETTHQMRSDLKNLNGVEYKNHRVYRKSI